MKVWQVAFPDNKIQVAADGVDKATAMSVILDFLKEQVSLNIEIVDRDAVTEQQAGVSQQVEEQG